MSEGGTTKGQETAYKRDLMKRLKVLAPEPGQVLLLEMPAQFFADRDEEQHAIVKKFADEIAKATGGRDIFLVPEGTLRAVDDPRKPKAPPEIAVPKPQIILPTGIRHT